MSVAKPVLRFLISELHPGVLSQRIATCVTIGILVLLALATRPLTQEPSLRLILNPHGRSHVAGDYGSSKLCMPNTAYRPIGPYGWPFYGLVYKRCPESDGLQPQRRQDADWGDSGRST